MNRAREKICEDEWIFLRGSTLTVTCDMSSTDSNTMLVIHGMDEKGNVISEIVNVDGTKPVTTKQTFTTIL